MKLYQIILLITFLLSVRATIRGIKVIPYFTYFMLMVVIFEIIINKILIHMYGNNITSGNIYIIFCVLYYQLIFALVVRPLWLKRSLMIFAFIWPVLSVVNWFYIQGYDQISSYSYGIGLIIACGIFLYWIYNRIFVEHEGIFRNPYFYFGSGILLLTFTIFPILFFFNYFNDGRLGEFRILVQASNFLLATGYLLTVLSAAWRERYELGKA